MNVAVVTGKTIRQRQESQKKNHELSQNKTKPNKPKQKQSVVIRFEMLRNGNMM